MDETPTSDFKAILKEVYAEKKPKKKRFCKLKKCCEKCDVKKDR